MLGGGGVNLPLSSLRGDFVCRNVLKATLDTENVDFPLCLTVNPVNIEGISTF